MRGVGAPRGSARFRDLGGGSRRVSLFSINRQEIDASDKVNEATKSRVPTKDAGVYKKQVMVEIVESVTEPGHSDDHEGEV